MNDGLPPWNVDPALIDIFQREEAMNPTIPPLSEALAEMNDLPSKRDIGKYDDMSDHLNLSDLSLNGALEEWADAYHERLEYELKGAWWAGYDYVHIYTDDTPSAFYDLEEEPFTYTETRYIHPSPVERPAEPEGVTYLHTYDIGAIPDYLLRKVFNGEVEEYIHNV